MNVSECATFLKAYIDTVPDEALLEYLLSVLSQPDESQASKDDVLYSLLPELGLLEDHARVYVVNCLCGTRNVKDNSNTCVFAAPQSLSSNSSSSRDRSNSNSKPRDNYRSSPSEIEDEDENEPVRVELHALLCSMGCADVADTLDNTIVGFLLNTFGNGQENDEENTGGQGRGAEGGPVLDEEEQLDLLRAYLEGLPEENLADIVVFFARCAADLKENRAIQAGIAADARASELNHRLQSIAADTRASRPAISAAEAAERARLVDKYGEEEVRAKCDSKGNLAKPAGVVMFVPNPKLESKIRYRDNNIVTHNGGKYIVEKEEEYDCGLRGRVKSKGKRGAGAGKGL